MRAVTYTAFGGPEVLSVSDVADPLLNPSSVLVRVAGAGVNPVDLKVREGALQGAFPHVFPIIPGWDVAGTVAATGPAVTRFAVGDRVMAYARKDTISAGTTAELVAVEEDAVAPVPDGLDLVAAGGLPLAGLTAHQLLDAVGIDTSSTVLVNGGSGGVGLFAVQLASCRGATVVATASPDAHPLLEELGARPVDRHLERDELLGAVGDALDGRPLDAVADAAGGDAVPDLIGLVADGGHAASIVSGPEVGPADAARGVEGRYVFVRPRGGELADLGRLAADGRLRIRVEGTYPLEQTAAAHERLAAGGVRGKLVVTP